MADLSSELRNAIRHLAESSTLLVASDYDGTIAPIVSDPAQALPDRRAVVALRALAELPQTHVAIISGRSLENLAAFLPGIDGVHLVGSHGSEFDTGFAADISPSKRALLDSIRQKLSKIADQAPGLTTEEKPASICLHFRNATREAAHAATEAVRNGPATEPGVHCMFGKMVIELAVVEADKGNAVEYLRRRVGAARCVFIGDDVTDENAFRSLSGPDVGIKVGEGETLASLRLPGQEDVARFLALLVEARSRWLFEDAPVPIEQHSMLSDQRALALVTPSARITWLCAPRLDSPALFADLLGGESAGYWSVEPEDSGARSSQQYAGDTMTVITAWDSISVTDYLDCSGNRTRQQAGRLDLVRTLKGSGRVRIEFAPRHNFGRIPTGLQLRADGIDIVGAHDFIVLRAPGVNWTIEQRGQHQTAIGIAELSGEPLVMELRYGTQSLAPAKSSEQTRRAETDRHWSAWTDSLELPNRYTDSVRRSAIILRSLCFGPSGAIAAAATTSLPERIGGVRNWDYRYCWPRDATMAAAALVRLGSTSEAMHLLDWLRGILEVLPSPEAISPLYAVTGEQIGPEAEITELSGYAGSRPVRIGNAASLQLQLDVFAPIVDLVALLAEAGAPLSKWHWSLVRSLAEAAARRWQDPDHGIWEPRTPPAHNVHSKVMCWQAIHRARHVAELLLADPPKDHDELPEAIRDEVLKRGWSEEKRMFTCTYDGGGPDAATLWTGLSGMLEPDDERFIATVDAVEQHLRKGPTVYRYFQDDGLPGSEGGFNLCTAWLIESLALIGRQEEAEDLFNSYLQLAGATGLMSEEYDPVGKKALGNVPQAYSHLGLINAALRLAKTD